MDYESISKQFKESRLILHDVDDMQVRTTLLLLFEEMS